MSSFFSVMYFNYKKKFFFKSPVEPLVLGGGGGQEYHSLLQGSNPGLHTVGRMLYRLSYQGSLKKYFFNYIFT